MKRLTLAAFTIALLTANVPASADGDRHGGNARHGDYPNDGHGDHDGGGPPHGNGDGRGYGPPPAYRHGGGYYGYRHGYNGHGYGGYYPPRYYPYRPYYAYRPYTPYYGYPYYPQHHNNNHGESAAYLVGGLVVGSLLTNAYNKSQQNAYYGQQTTQPIQVVATPQGRRLLRDLNGNCYERTTDGAGNELRTELPASACNW